MTVDFELVEYRQEFKEGVVDLQRHLWGPNLEMNRAYFEWKHERNPYVTPALAILALRGDIVVGMRGLMGTCWEVGRSCPSTILPYADDFVIAPEHRGTGLARRIMDAVVHLARTKGFPYLVNLSAGPVTALESLAIGWRSAGAMRPVALTSGRAFLERATRRLHRLVMTADTGNVNSPFARLDRSAPRGSGDIVVTREPWPEAMATLVRQRGYDGRIRHVRDAMFFAWRFMNPHHEYRFLFLGGEPLAGYLVLQRQIARPHDATVRVVDWEATDVRDLATLLAFACSKGKFREIVAWEAAQRSGAAAVLRDHGFVPTELPARQRGMPAVLVRPAGPLTGPWMLGEHQVLDPDAWDIRLLYSMHG